MPEYNISNIDSRSTLRSAYLDYGADLGGASFITDDLDFVMMSDFELDNELRAAMSEKSLDTIWSSYPDEFNK